MRWLRQRPAFAGETSGEQRKNIGPPTPGAWHNSTTYVPPAAARNTRMICSVIHGSQNRNQRP